MDDDSDWIVPGKNRALQKPQGVDRRVKFGAKRQAMFLEHLAATCNVAAAAAAAEISVSAVYRCRMRDAGFRDCWAVAIEQGYARLEAALLARAMRGDARPKVKGDLEVAGPDSPEEVDWEKGVLLLRQHRRGGADLSPQTRKAAERVPIEQVAAKLIKRIKALGVVLPEGANDQAASPSLDPGRG